MVSSVVPPLATVVEPCVCTLFVVGTATVVWSVVPPLATVVGPCVCSLFVVGTARVVWSVVPPLAVMLKQLSQGSFLLKQQQL